MTNTRLLISLMLVMCWQLHAVNVAGVGDSIIEGVCSDYDPDFHSQIDHGTESGNTNMSVMHILAWKSGVLTTTNIGTGSATWYSCNTNSKAWIPNSTHWVVAHCGINDLTGGWVWSDVLTNIAAIKTRCDTIGAKLVLDEIWPYGVGTAEQNDTIRTWNDGYRLWASTNGALFMYSHDLMGAVKVETGKIDKMNTSYDCNADGLHLNTTGVLVWATNIWNYLKADMALRTATTRTGTIRSP